MARQSAGKPIPSLPQSPRNAQGNADGNPSRDSAPVAEGPPVSPAVARTRAGAAAAQGHNQGQGGGK